MDYPVVHLMEGFDNFSLAQRRAVSMAHGAEAEGFQTGSSLRISGPAYLDPAAVYALQGTTKQWITINFRVYRETASARARYLVRTGANTGGSNGIHGAWIDPDGTITIAGTGSPIPEQISPPGAVKVGRWHHVEYRSRYWGSNARNSELYLDGTLVCTFSRSRPADPGNLYLSIGTQEGDGVRVDNVAVWSTDELQEPVGPVSVKNLRARATAIGQWLGSDGDRQDNHLLTGAEDGEYVSSRLGAMETDSYLQEGIANWRSIFAVAPYIAASGSEDSTGTFFYGVESPGGRHGRDLQTADGAFYSEEALADREPGSGSPWTNDEFDAMTTVVRT